MAAVTSSPISDGYECFPLSLPSHSCYSDKYNERICISPTTSEREHHFIYSPESPPLMNFLCTFLPVFLLGCLSFFFLIDLWVFLMYYFLLFCYSMHCVFSHTSMACLFTLLTASFVKQISLKWLIVHYGDSTISLTCILLTDMQVVSSFSLFWITWIIFLWVSLHMYLFLPNCFLKLDS